MNHETIKKIPIIGVMLKKIGGLYRDQKNSWNQYSFYLLHKKLISRNRILRDSYKGKRAFVLATGPSIRGQNLSSLAGEFCISISNFFVHPDFKIIKPAYHLFAQSHSPISDEQMRTLFEDAGSKMPDGQKVLVSIVDKYIVDNFKLFQKQDVYYYSVGRTGVRVGTDIDFTKEIPRIQTSNHAAMYLAMFCGAQELYLLGCDHDWIIHYGESRHFYDEKDHALTRGGYNEWTKDFEFVLESQVKLWQLYKAIKTYAERRSISIKNCTPGSLLDVFPKIKLETLLHNII